MSSEASVGLLEPPEQVGALPPAPEVPTLPPVIENMPVAPESADSASIVSKLHEFDAKRVGDDRKVRHERARYINELVKTQSSDILIDAASHFMSVGDDGKIKESSSLKSLRDRLVKEKGIELAAQGMEKDSIVKEQVGLYKNILTKAAETLPDEQRIRYQSRRLTPNVAAKRRTLEGRNRSKKTEVPVAPASSGVPIATESLSRRMVQEAQQPKIDAAQAALDRAKDPLPSDNPDVYFDDISRKAAEYKVQTDKTDEVLSRVEENKINNFIKAEEARNQARTDAADEAESRRDALKSQGTYVDPGDPEDTTGQERVKEYAVQAQEARQEAVRQAEIEANKAAFEKERAEQRAKFDAVKVETSTGYTDAPEKPDFSSAPLPSAETSEFFASIGRKAADAAEEQTQQDTTMERIKQEHADPLKDVRERAQRSAAAGRPISYKDRIDLRTGRLTEPTQSIMKDIIEENAKRVESQIDTSTAEGRVRRFANSKLKLAAIGVLGFTITYGGAEVYQDYHQPTDSTPMTEINLGSSQMPSQQALEESGVQIDSSSHASTESPRSVADEMMSNAPHSTEGEVHTAPPQVKGIGAKLRGFFGGNKNG